MQRIFLSLFGEDPTLFKKKKSIIFVLHLHLVIERLQQGVAMFPTNSIAKYLYHLWVWERSKGRKLQYPLIAGSFGRIFYRMIHPVIRAFNIVTERSIVKRCQLPRWERGEMKEEKDRDRKQDRVTEADRAQSNAYVSWTHFASTVSHPEGWFLQLTPASGSCGCP